MPTKRALCAAALLPLLYACTLLKPSEEHATLDNSPQELDVPTSVTSVGWDWQPPDKTSITHVSPTQHGVAAMVDDGIVALAGDTGEEHWHYRRPEEPITSAAVTPDGSKVMLSYAGDHTDEEDEDEPPAQNEIVLLDAATGDIINEHTADFAPHSGGGLDGNVHRENGRDPGIITDEARVIQDSDGGEHGDIVAYSLEGGEELWRLSPEVEQGPEHAEPVLSHGFPAQDTLILSLLFTDQEGEGAASPDNPRDYTFALAGVDAETGSDLWQREAFGQSQVDYPITSTTLDHEGHHAFTSVDFTDHEQEWVLNSETGDLATDTDFISGHDGDIIGAVDDQLVTVHEGEDEEEVQYSYEDLSGDTRDLVSVEAPTARRLNETFIVPLADGLAWLDVNQQDDFSWDPAQIVVTDKSNGNTETLDLEGLMVEEDRGHDGTPPHSMFPDPEAMTLAPGSLVVQGERDEDGSPTDTLVGVVP
ncbi:PQQ-binding-like beta-propeller repeat protein [Nocardiopsis sp. HNM0947]|uniref:PQQ-binding-like beta-propeller repeat protein n=1 Tax=Nocardiopsis coralli TaxID=2772213 RepID=A0ABR9P7Z7_9ACTN|nr:PQQ-binding-like beta-propeller repeat protein [Nocardiopsis coralli]MBE2999942.1 PQQ-binding-like beta-propeller repeat protein [Nocardiopsis coralli]